MNGYRIGFETGLVRLEASPEALDCLTIGPDEVRALLERTGQSDLLRVVGSAAASGEAGQIWERQGTQVDPRALPGFRYLYERPSSMAPTNPKTAPLIPWS